VDEAALRGAERRLGRRLPGPLADVLRKNGGGVVDAYGTDVVWPLERIVEENLSFWSGEAFAGLYMPFGTTAGVTSSPSSSGPSGTTSSCGSTRPTAPGRGW
jgi:hypothetical protein